MRVHPLLRLTRPALAPTAAADIVAAATMAGGARLLPLVAATLGSVCLYAGGMVFNDLCDRDRDVELHPERPLVKKPELGKWAFLFFVLLCAAGLGLCALAGAVWPALSVTVLACAYNLGLKQKFPLDAVTLGGARACNLWIGLAVAGSGVGFTYPAAYLLFIGGITAASRTEDVDLPRKRRLGLLGSFLPMAMALGAFASLATESAALFLVPAAVLALLLLAAIASGTRSAAMRFVFGSLLSIYLLHAVCLWTRGGRLSVLAIAGCAALSVFLLKALKPQQEQPKAE